MIDIHEIYFIIKKLKNRKSSGTDNIANEMEYELEKLRRA